MIRSIFAATLLLVALSARALDPPPSVTLSANPTTIQSGGSSVISWTSRNAASCVASMNGQTASAPLRGSVSYPFKATTSLTMTCSGAGAPASASVTVTVSGEPPPPPPPASPPPASPPPASPPPPPSTTQYRGIPDPSVALGFDVRGTYLVDQVVTGNRGNTTLTGTGTASNPYVIDARGATFTKLGVTGSYVILLGGKVNAPSGSGPMFGSSCNRCVFRDVEVAGPKVDSGHSGAVGVASMNVLLRAKIHGFGDNRQSAREQDYHGIKPMVSDVWILDSEIYDNSGDSIQCGDASRGSCSRVYIGGNYLHHNRENAVDIKDSTGVVVSSNRMEGFRPTSSSPGEALILHDDAVDARVYDNVISDSTIGIVSSGLRGHIIDGNSIQAMSIGIDLRGTTNITVTNNTITAPTRIRRGGGVTGTVQP